MLTITEDFLSSLVKFYYNYFTSSIDSPISVGITIMGIISRVSYGAYVSEGEGLFPHLWGWAGKVTLHFSETWYRPHPVGTS